MKHIISLVVAAVLAVALLLPAHAQTKATVPGGPAINALANWADADLDGAIALSTSVAGLQDNVGAACWTAFKDISAVVKAHPLPATLKLASDIQALRLVVAGLNKICANPNCSQVWSDAQAAVGALSVAPLPITFGSLCAKVPVVGLGSPAINFIGTVTPR